jgi:hypothetical protein
MNNEVQEIPFIKGGYVPRSLVDSFSVRGNFLWLLFGISKLPELLLLCYRAIKKVK